MNCGYCQSVEPCYDGFTSCGFPCQHPERKRMADPACEHLDFECSVDVNRLSEKEGGPIERYSADVRIRCAKCGLPFRFIGLPAGVDLNGAAVSIDGAEARLAIAPKGQVVTPLESVGGFTVRRTK